MSARRALNIALVDDDANLREALSLGLELAGHHVRVFADPSALLATDLASIQIVITDLAMPGMDGLALTARLKELRPLLPVIVLTAHGSIERAVEAVREGAADFLQKPVTTERLLVTLEKAAELAGLRGEVDHLRAELSHRHRILGDSRAMRDVLSQIDRVAPTPTTVLVTGETGVGKELVARRIHALSAVSTGPFVAVNCAAIPSELIESELFGHRRGAFTGAVSDHDGVFVRADGGTLLLDEIGDLPLPAQAKLLRVLEDRAVTPIGATKSRTVSVRVIAATNADCERNVAAGRFRADLYYRLQVFPIAVPPLRERTEDIEVIARDRLGAHPIDPEAMAALRSAAWPGNVRELLNVLERVLILSGAGTPQARPIGLEDLPESVRERAPAAPADYGFRLPEAGIDFFALEKYLLDEALRRTNGNQAAAARLLGMTRHTFLYRLEKFRIEK